MSSRESNNLILFQRSRKTPLIIAAITIFSVVLLLSSFVASDFNADQLSKLFIAKEKTDYSFDNRILQNDENTSEHLCDGSFKHEKTGFKAECGKCKEIKIRQKKSEPGSQTPPLEVSCKKCKLLYSRKQNVYMEFTSSVEVGKKLCRSQFVVYMIIGIIACLIFGVGACVFIYFSGRQSAKSHPKPNASKYRSNELDERYEEPHKQDPNQEPYWQEQNSHSSSQIFVPVESSAPNQVQNNAIPDANVNYQDEGLMKSNAYDCYEAQVSYPPQAEEIKPSVNSPESVEPRPTAFTSPEKPNPAPETPQAAGNGVELFAPSEIMESQDIKQEAPPNQSSEINSNFFGSYHQPELTIKAAESPVEKPSQVEDPKIFKSEFPSSQGLNLMQSSSADPLQQLPNDQLEDPKEDSNLY